MNTWQIGPTGIIKFEEFDTTYKICKTLIVKMRKYRKKSEKEYKSINCSVYTSSDK